MDRGIRDARRHDACGVDSTRVERIRKCGRLRKASSEVSSCDDGLFTGPFEAIRFFGVQTQRDLHISSLGFSNRASTDVAPKQKRAGFFPQNVFWRHCQCLLNYHVRNFWCSGPSLCTSNFHEQLASSEIPAVRISCPRPR
jgi:hypothetical protein